MPDSALVKREIVVDAAAVSVVVPPPAAAVAVTISVAVAETVREVTLVQVPVPWALHVAVGMAAPSCSEGRGHARVHHVSRLRF